MPSESLNPDPLQESDDVRNDGRGNQVPRSVAQQTTDGIGHSIARRVSGCSCARNAYISASRSTAGSGRAADDPVADLRSRLAEVDDSRRRAHPARQRLERLEHRGDPVLLGRRGGVAGLDDARCSRSSRCPPGARERRATRAKSSRRNPTPRRRKMVSTWCATVWMERPRRRAISALESPFRRNSGPRAGPWEPGEGRRERAGPLQDGRGLPRPPRSCPRPARWDRPAWVETGGSAIRSSLPVRTITPGRGWGVHPGRPTGGLPREGQDPTGYNPVSG